MTTASISSLLKWLVVGLVRPAEHSLWSPFVQNKWFVESLMHFPMETLGTPFAAWYQRMLGATIGEGVYLQTPWLSEPDLCKIDDNACLDTHSEIQTHLFEDRVQRLDYVTIKSGVTVHQFAVALLGSVLDCQAELLPLSVPLPYETLAGPSVMCSGSWAGNMMVPVSRFRAPVEQPRNGLCATQPAPKCVWQQHTKIAILVLTVSLCYGPGLDSLVVMITSLIDPWW